MATIESSRQSGPPKPAATVVLLRAAPAFEVLVTVRPQNLRFMGGATVFPGGGVAKADLDPAWEQASVLSGEDAARLLDEDDRRLALGFLVCALRESFEEVGFISGRGPVEDLPRDADAQAFLQACLDLGVVLGTDALVPAGRWITPLGSNVRYDARFFIARAPEGWTPRPDPGEVAECRWTMAADALEQLAAGEAIMAPPTAAMLQRLASFDDVDSALHALAGMDLEPEGGIYKARLSPLVEVILAPNPSVMTGPGTNTYVVGRNPALVIDPAVDDGGYVDAVVASAGRTAAILVTHRHSDHVGGTRALAEKLRVPVRAFFEDDAGGVEVRPLVDGEVIEFGGGALESVFSPGHAADHVSFWLSAEKALFAGDNVLGEGTSVIAPPDGDMKAYLDSLRRLELLQPQRIYPGHFRPLDRGTEVLREYISHRKQRETKILAALAGGPATLEEMVTEAYDDTPVELHPIAQMSALAHLQALEADGRVRQASGKWEMA